MNAALRLAGWGEFWRNRTLRALALAYGFVWFVTAIKPFNREDWLLENLLVFLGLPAIVALYRHRLLSNALKFGLFIAVRRGTFAEGPRPLVFGQLHSANV